MSARDFDLTAARLHEKAYYGRRLLEHGPLHYSEFREITGWPSDECEAVLRHMRRTETVECANGVWRLKA